MAGLVVCALLVLCAPHGAGLSPVAVIAQAALRPAPAAPPGQDRRGSDVAAPISDVPSLAIVNQLVNDPSADTTEQDTQVGAALVLGSGSTLIAAFSDSGSYVAGSSNRFTGFSRSANGGATWVDGGTLPGNDDGGNPAMARDTVTGRIFQATYDLTAGNRIQVFRSDDDGATWAAPVNGTPGQVTAFDHSLAVDNAAGTGQGNVYVAFRDYTPGSTSTSWSTDVYLSRSTDGGDTFGPTAGVRISASTLGVYGVGGPSVVVGPDHAVYVFWWDATETVRTIRMRKSTDFGVSFGDPVIVASLTHGNDNYGNGRPQAAINAATGHLFVVHRDWGVYPDYGDIYFQHSSDGGLTWSGRVRVTDDTPQDPAVFSQGFPSLAVTPDGTRLFVNWYDGRLDQSGWRREFWGVTGTVSAGAVTFGPNFMISDSDFPVIDFGQDPTVNPAYVGESTRPAADNEYFYTAWTDTRLSNSLHANNPDIRFAKIPVNGPGGILRLLATSPAGLDEFGSNDLTLTLVNRGSSTASGIVATLSSSTAGVVIEQATQPYSALGAGASAANAAPYRVRFTCAPGCPASVDFVLTVSTATDGGFTATARLPVFPRVSAADVTLPEGNSPSSRQIFNFGVSLSRPSAAASHVLYETRGGGVPTFTSSTPLTIPADAPVSGGGAAGPYPATLNVSGVTGTVTRVAVRLNDLTHAAVGDLDVLLVGPQGQVAMFMSDLAWGRVSGVDLTFRESAPVLNGAVISGTYGPTDHGGPESMPAPAPPPPGGLYPTSLSVFNGVNPNGAWQLFVSDDSLVPGTVGSLSGFTLVFTTTESDVEYASGRLAFSPGTTSQSVPVAINGDTVAEPNETFTVALLDPGNLVPGDIEAVGTIVNDDGATLPTAVNDQFAATFNGTLTVPAPGVLGNDLANGGGPLAAVLLQPPQHGTLSLSAQGGFTYTPVAGYQGYDRFYYFALGPGGGSAGAEVFLTIIPAPVATNDAYTTSSGTPLTVPSPGVLSNDTWSAYFSVSVQLVSSPSSGTLSLTPSTGGFTYTPNVGFVGVDTFTYRLASGTLLSDVATVSLAVSSATPSAPTAVNDAFTVSNQGVLTVPAPGVLANDITNNGGPMSAALTTGATIGTLTFGASGGFTYVPRPGFSGTASFTYRAVNSLGSSTPATVTISVTGAPGPPTALDDAYATSYRTPLNIGAPGVLANDSANSGGAMTASLVSDVAHGTLSLSPDGGLTYTPDEGFAGPDTFTYRPANPLGPGGAATVTITVAPPTTVQAPFNLRVDAVVGNAVTLRWDTWAVGPQAAVFVLEGGVSRGQVLASIPTGSASPVFTFVAPTGSFFIRVHGQNGTDRSPASNEVALHVNVPVVPTAPASLLGLVTGNTLDLTWKPTFGGGPPTGTVLDVTGSVTTSVPMGATDRFSFAPVPGGTYTFHVRQSNAGGMSAPSEPVTLSFPLGCSGIPAPPANLLGYRLGNTAYVMWDPPAAGPAPTSYLLDVTGSFVGTIPTPGRLLSGVVGRGTYHVRVRSVNACGTSPFTAAQAIVVP